MSVCRRITSQSRDPTQTQSQCASQYDKTLYKQRNRIEHCFSKLKYLRRFATRYEKSEATFEAIIALACSWLRLRLYVDTA
jgi:transposase